MAIEKNRDHEPPEYHIPESIQRYIDAIDEKSFWELENLATNFAQDISFGVKMWGGMHEIVSRSGANAQELDEFATETEKFLISAATAEQAAKQVLVVRQQLI